MIDEKILQNQALASHALFFDPVNRDLERYNDEKGRPMGRYTEKAPGVRVLPDGSAVFTVDAPHAKTVEVAGIGGTMGREHHPLHKDADGLWRATVRGIGAGMHYHEYFVDGNSVTSDLAPYGYGCSRAINFFEMPDNDSGFYLLQDVPHGTVRMDYYFSSVTGRLRNCFVYTPPGYETSQERYPVVYLQHGGGETESGWVWQGKAPYILDNLLAAGECRRMIVVMNSGYAFFPDGSGHPARGCFDRVLAEDCIPFIDGKYRTIAGAAGRAMAGLSMGGFQTQATVMRYPELFSAMGLFSAILVTDDGADDYTPVLEHSEVFRKNMRLLFVTSGEQEPMCSVNRATVQELAQKGLPAVFCSYPGYHEWQVWRYSARAFFQRVFRS